MYDINSIKNDIRKAVDKFLFPYLDEDEVWFMYIDIELLASFAISLIRFLQKKYSISIVASYEDCHMYFCRYYHKRYSMLCISKDFYTKNFDYEEFANNIFKFIDTYTISKELNNSIEFYTSPIINDFYEICNLIKYKQEIPLINEYLYFDNTNNCISKNKILKSFLQRVYPKDKEYKKYHSISYKDSTVFINKLLKYKMNYNDKSNKGYSVIERKEKLNLENINKFYSLLKDGFIYYTNIDDINNPFINPAKWVGGFDALYGGDEVVFIAINEKYIVYLYQSCVTWAET